MNTLSVLVVLTACPFIFPPRSALSFCRPVQEEVDLDDMNENEDAATWSWDCRCGGQYIVSEKDLEAGCEYYGCNSCTLCTSKKAYNALP